MRLLDLDGFACLLLPLLRKGGVDLLVKLPRDIVGDIEDTGLGEHSQGADEDKSEGKACDGENTREHGDLPD